MKCLKCGIDPDEVTSGRCNCPITILGVVVNDAEMTLERIRNIIRHPPCCHVSGCHDPTHFRNDPRKICYLQEGRAYQKIKMLLSINDREITAMSESDCGWCHDYEKSRTP